MLGRRQKWNSQLRSFRQLGRILSLCRSRARAHQQHGTLVSMQIFHGRSLHQKWLLRPARALCRFGAGRKTSKSGQASSSEAKMMQKSEGFETLVLQFLQGNRWKSEKIIHCSDEIHRVIGGPLARHFKMVAGEADCKFILRPSPTPNRYVVYKKESPIPQEVMYLTTSTGTATCAAGRWLVQKTSSDDYVDVKLGYFELKGLDGIKGVPSTPMSMHRSWVGSARKAKSAMSAVSDRNWQCWFLPVSSNKDQQVCTCTVHSGTAVYYGPMNYPLLWWCVVVALLLKIIGT